MQKKITYILLLFVGILIGFTACEFVNRAKYQSEVQKFRNTKTLVCNTCDIIKKDNELEVLTASSKIN
jgi:hypothetical protein